MARKVNILEVRQPKTVVVGAGITEYWYLKHLKKKCGFGYILRPSLFGDESMKTIHNRITEGISAGSTVVCVFDEDVRQWNDSEKRKMDEVHRKFDNHEKVVIASSMPSIEYWLLLHFENTNRFFGTSAKVMDSLRKYLSGFDKKENYLKQEKWLDDLIAGEKMNSAYNRAKILAHSGESYSDMWKAIDIFRKK